MLAHDPGDVFLVHLLVDGHEVGLHDLAHAAGGRQPFHLEQDVAEVVSAAVAFDHGADGAGLTAAALGDVDGDGRPDFAIAAPGGDAVPGRVFIYSGATGQMLHALTDGTVGFGAALAAVGDVVGARVIARPPRGPDR